MRATSEPRYSWRLARVAVIPAYSPKSLREGCVRLKAPKAQLHRRSDTLLAIGLGPQGQLRIGIGVADLVRPFWQVGDDEAHAGDQPAWMPADPADRLPKKSLKPMDRVLATASITPNGASGAAVIIRAVFQAVHGKKRRTRESQTVARGAPGHSLPNVVTFDGVGSERGWQPSPCHRSPKAAWTLARWFPEGVGRGSQAPATTLRTGRTR